MNHENTNFLQDEQAREAAVRELLRWGVPRPSMAYSSILDPAVAVVIALVLTFIGKALFDLSKLETVIAFGALSISFAMPVSSGVFPSTAHIAMALKALAISTFTKR